MKVEICEYKSPIDTFIGEVQETFENAVYKAVQNIGVNIDKEELKKALAYDRGQFELGYSAGRESREREIVRCNDCVWYDKRRSYANNNILYECRNLKNYFPIDFFCKDGERSEDVH